METKLFIRIKGWEKYQHYKDRNPPWIKLHRELLTSLTWTLADDASRVLAIACMLLAAATENKIPANVDYVKRVAYLHETPDFSQLEQLEFIEFIDDSGKTIKGASKMLASARPETETETETETEKPSPRKRKARRENQPDLLQMAKATGETRHSRIQQIIIGFYLDWAGTECPWDGSEGKQLMALLKSTPHWPDSHFITCLDNLALSVELIPKGDRPREWLSRLPKFLKGPLDKFGHPIVANNLKRDHLGGYFDGNVYVTKEGKRLPGYIPPPPTKGIQ